MDNQTLHQIFRTMQTPVLVCKGEPGYLVRYANPGAGLLFHQKIRIYGQAVTQVDITLEELFGAENSSLLKTMVEIIFSEGKISGFPLMLPLEKEEHLTLQISGNVLDGEEGDFILYFSEAGEKQQGSGDIQGSVYANAIISLVLKEAYQTLQADLAINNVLRLAGQYVNVSRAYIFEELNPAYVRNSYEWCNSGVEPAIARLQSLKKSDCNYEKVKKSGKFICENSRLQSDWDDRRVLKTRNIKSIAVLSLCKGQQTLGCVGFEDCDQYRRWTKYEIQTLEQIANVLVSLINRRKIQEEERQNLVVLRTVSDNFDQLIYARDIASSEVLFANRSLALALRKKPYEIVGGLCWEVLQNRKERCEYCPQPNLVDEEGNILRHEYVWEHWNPTAKRWYRIKDSIIKWFDGRDVHLEITTDITDQKKYQQELEQYASMDGLTGAYNREWGYQIMADIMRDGQDAALSLCFIDVDNLKYTNDTHGHDAGDELLITIVNTIRASLRKSDIMCRWGGDEFVILMRCSEEHADNLMKRIEGNFEAINQSGAYPYRLSVSYGIAALDKNGQKSLDDSITAADSRMYRRKLEKREEE